MEIMMTGTAIDRAHIERRIAELTRERAERSQTALACDGAYTTAINKLAAERERRAVAAHLHDLAYAAAIGELDRLLAPPAPPADA